MDLFMQENGKFPLAKGKYILNSKVCGDTSLAHLSEQGYTHLYGLDLDNKIYDMPHYTRIKYSYGDMLNTHFPERMFDMVYTLISISTLQNAELEKFIAETKRILDNGGILLIKADRKNKTPVINRLKKFGFKFLREKYDNNSVFLWSKIIKPDRKEKIKEINIVAESLGQREGVDTYVQSLKKRFVEAGIKVNLYKTYEEADKSKKTIIQYVPAFGFDFPKGDYIIDVHQTVSKTRFRTEIKEIMRKIFENPQELIAIIRLVSSNFGYAMMLGKRAGKSDEETQSLQKHKLIVRSREIAESSGLIDYTVVPLAAYHNPRAKIIPSKELHIGSMGFARRSKNFDQICELAKRLGIKATLTISTSGADKETQKATSYIAHDLYQRYNSKMIKILVGFHSEEELAKILSGCSHFISAANDGMFQSGSLRYMMKFGKAVISTDNYQAREAQVYRVKSLDNITRQYLKKTTEPINIDDGFRYLLKVLEQD